MKYIFIFKKVGMGATKRYKSGTKQKQLEERVATN